MPQADPQDPSIVDDNEVIEQLRMQMSELMLQNAVVRAVSIKAQRLLMAERADREETEHTLRQEISALSIAEFGQHDGHVDPTRPRPIHPHTGG